MLPKISIITPSYNQGQFLEETISSVLSQDYPNLEYIVIDGGSKDQSVDIIRKYASSLTYWISEKDSGQSEALNKGFKRATGDIVTWLNSDDVYLPGTLLKIAKHFTENPESTLLHGKTIVFGEGLKDEERGAPEEELASLYLAYIPFPQPSSFFRRHVLTELGYLDESLQYGMDFDLLARIALNYRIDRSTEIFSRYRIHPASKSNNAMGFLNDWNVVFSRILRSVPGTSEKIEQLKAIGLYRDEKETYKFAGSVNKELLEKSFYHFLKAQAQMFYIAGESKKSLRIFNIIKREQPELYKREKLAGLHLRSFLFRPGLLKFLRSVKF
jgi:glycosyltransferase involved in cell wall biosynthesis